LVAIGHLRTNPGLEIRKRCNDEARDFNNNAISMDTIKSIFRMLLAWLESGHFVDLLSARHHTSYLARQRLTAFVTRIRLVSIAFSVLTLIWIPFDAATLSEHHWEILAASRVLAALVFLWLALMPEREPSRARTLASLVIMLTMPMSIYLVSQFLFSGLPLQGMAAINAQLYQALPLVVLAGLSIFPLVAAEGLILAAVIAAVLTGINLFWVCGNATEAAATFLLIMLISGVYLLACAIQLHYMMVLLRRASHDLLTGALTRRSGVEVLDLHFRLASDLDQPLSVLFVDADDFKKINDEFGHDAGDQALKNIVSKLQKALRQGDLVIRWGGEEFVVLLINTPLSGAKTVVANITREWFGQRPDGAPLTASLGLAERRTDGTADWVQLMDLADQRMYAAKAAGKACCVSHEGVLKAQALA
jgi:diguanylate cyclase (GGDEF)-like protein